MQNYYFFRTSANKVPENRLFRTLFFALILQKNFWLINGNFFPEPRRATHPTAYKALKANASLVPEIRAQEHSLTGMKVRYIPKRAVRNNALLRKTVKDGDILAITCNMKGLDIAHLGFAVWRSDGLHLLNASMIHKKVVEEPMTLYEYMQKHKTHTGIRVVRINSK